MLAGVLLGGAAPALAEAVHAIAMHGAPAMPDDFTALPYVNPDAPQGGRVTEGVLGTFDSLNPLIVQGDAVQPIRGYVIESLMARGYDEPFTLYGLLARTVETDDARSYVTFTLDPAAHFSDGVPVTADDVVFSWQLLRDHGRPNHRTYYSKVAKAEILDPRTVRFDFADRGDRELPLILGLMPVLPKHAIDVATFENSTLAKPIGSGPYVVADVNAGQSVTLQARSRIIGAAICRSIAACGISTNCASISIATTTPISKRSRPGSTTCAAKPIRRAGRPAMIFPPCATAASSRKPSQRLAEIRFRFCLQYAAADFFRYPRAAGDCAVVRLRMDQPQFFLQSLSAQRELLRRFRTFRLSSPGRR